MPHPRHNRLYVVHGDRINACKRLVEHHEFRVRYECPRYLEPAAFTTGKSVSLALAQALDTELVEKLFQPFRTLRRGQREGLGNGHYVVLDWELSEDRRLLRKIPNSASSPLVHRELRDVFAVEENPTGKRLNESDDHVESR